MRDTRGGANRTSNQTGTFGRNTTQLSNLNNSNNFTNQLQLKGPSVGPGRFSGEGTIYSSNENVLLRWIELISKEVYSVEKLWKDFEIDMTDGIGVGSLLQKYVGGDKKRLFNLKREVQNDEDRQFNLNKVKEALMNNGIMQMPEVLNEKPNAREFVLFLTHLYQILPHYMPRDSLTFPLILGGTCTRNIMLQNPSKKTIYYWVNLEAHRDFSIDDKFEVKLEPGETTAFAVKYTARISK